jgi:hypothetical protein
MVQRYLLDSPTIAFTSTDGSVMMIPKDSIVEVSLALPDRHGLIEVGFGDQVVMMFTEDIRQRGKLLDPT